MLRPLASPRQQAQLVLPLRGRPVRVQEPLGVRVPDLVLVATVLVLVALVLVLVVQVRVVLVNVVMVVPVNVVMVVLLAIVRPENVLVNDANRVLVMDVLGRVRATTRSPRLKVCRALADQVALVLVQATTRLLLLKVCPDLVRIVRGQIAPVRTVQVRIAPATVVDRLPKVRQQGNVQVGLVPVDPVPAGLVPVGHVLTRG